MKYFADASPYCKELGKRKRIRKSASRLSDNEKSELRKALELAIKNKTEWMNFPDIANFHGAPYIVCQDKRHLGCCPHGMGDEDRMDFLPWHRLLLGIMITNLLYLNICTTYLLPTYSYTSKNL